MFIGATNRRLAGALLALAAWGVMWNAMPASAGKPGGGGGGGGGSSPVHFSLALVGDLGGGYSSADGINNLGDVVGWSYTTTAQDVNHGFLWSAGTGTIDVNDLLPPIEGVVVTNAAGINDSREIVGTFTASDSSTRAFCLSLNGSGGPFFDDLHALAQSQGLNWTSSQALSITELGDVFGFYTDVNPHPFGIGYFVYIASSDMVTPLTLPGTWSPVPAPMNDSGQLAGSIVIQTNSSGYTTAAHAARYTPGVGTQDLGVLKRVTNYDWSSGHGVNQSGQVVGSSIAGAVKGNGIYHAFRYSDGVGMLDLGTLGGTGSSGDAINSHGDVVGSSNVASGASHPFLYTDTFKMIDLTLAVTNSPVDVSKVQPGRINDAGMITGFVNLSTGNGMACVLIPTK